MLQTENEFPIISTFVGVALAVAQAKKHKAKHTAGIPVFITYPFSLISPR
jgi:hypothetical protein